MSPDPGSDSKLRVLIAGGGVAGLEAAFALRELAPESTARTVLSPGAEFVYRPLTVREPFAYPSADRYPLAPIVRDAGAELVADALAWVDPGARVAHTAGGGELHYDALLIALGAQVTPRYAHALTVDDRTMDEALHGLLQDVEDGYTHRLAFVAPGRMPWQLPMYELALMTAARAYDMGVELEITIVSPEDAPLAIFGADASAAVAGLLQRAGIETVNSAYAEVPRSGEVLVNPGDRHLRVDRVVALPELYGPALRGVAHGEHGFIRTTPYMEVPGTESVYAA